MGYGKYWAFKYTCIVLCVLPTFLHLALKSIFMTFGKLVEIEALKRFRCSSHFIKLWYNLFNNNVWIRNNWRKTLRIFQWYQTLMPIALVSFIYIMVSFIYILHWPNGWSSSIWNIMHPIIYRYKEESMAVLRIFFNNFMRFNHIHLMAFTFRVRNGLNVINTPIASTTFKMKKTIWSPIFQHQLQSCSVSQIVN